MPLSADGLNNSEVATCFAGRRALTGLIRPGFSGSVISLNEEVEWAPYPPDLSLLDFLSIGLPQRPSAPRQAEDIGASEARI